ncbi:hypothetical protein AAC387_Pa07g3349 [Persea americana]
MGKHALGLLFWIDGSGCTRSLDGSKVSSPKEPEPRAILRALTEASLRGFQNILLLPDALEVVIVINGSPDWSVHPMLLDIKVLSTEFEDISFFTFLSLLMVLLMNLLGTLMGR